MDTQAAELAGLAVTPPWHDRTRQFRVDRIRSQVRCLCEVAARLDMDEAHYLSEEAEAIYDVAHRVMAKARRLTTRRASECEHA